MDGTTARGELKRCTVGSEHEQTERRGPVAVPFSTVATTARTQGPALRAGASLRFALATPADDAAIRRLLRENPMPGAIAVTFEREPVAVGGALRPDASLKKSNSGLGDGCFEVVRRDLGPPARGEQRAMRHARAVATPARIGPIAADHAATPTEQVIVAYENDHLACTGRCGFRRRYLNGEPCRVGYLGELRLDARARRNVDLLRGGYGFFRDLQRADPADVYFTSIAADNRRARRVLERGLPGLPRYDFLTEFVTLLIPVGRARRGGRPDLARRSLGEGRNGGTETSEAIAFLNAHAARHQLAAHWTEPELAEVDELIAIRDGDESIGCAALWDQRACRQTVIRGYAPALARLRPLLNLVAPVLRRPRLPPVGAVVPTAFLSPLATTPGHNACVSELVRAAFAPARRRGIELLTLGFAADDPRLALVRRHFRAREYHTRLYRVSWADMSRGERTFDGRLFFPEVALL